MSHGQSFSGRVIGVILLGCASICNHSTAEADGPPKPVEKTRSLELLKEDKARLLVRDSACLVRELSGVSQRGVLATASKLWPPGSKLRVCFIGGTPKLHKKIARVASEWTRYGNISFDFGQEGPDDDCRLSNPNETCEVRVGFEHVRFYLPYVGTDALTAPPDQVTINFRGFETQSPSDVVFRSTVLHEFGHVLGFLHTHQNPGPNCGLLLRDDPTYQLTRDNKGQLIADSNGRRPGAYRVFEEIYHLDSGSIHQLLDPFQVSGDPNILWFHHDSDSVMHYSFPASVFREGEKSPCYGRERSQLSRGDKISMAVLYPSGSQEDEVVNARVDSLLEVLQVADLPQNVRTSVIAQLKRLSKKPGSH